ncbi:hypothetical protein J4462_00110 [Candidatus Pacearchaeota archaeon]|nr:hypothetical protein [Candidatus Pacearchaeota archaeon]
MQIETILIANLIFLVITLAVLLSVSHRNDHNNSKVKEDIRKIKDQIFG